MKIKAKMCLNNKVLNKKTQNGTAKQTSLRPATSPGGTKQMNIYI